jgi:alpha-ribazole phosphatase
MESSLMPARQVIAVRHAPTASQGLCVGSGDVPCTMSGEDAVTRILSSVANCGFQQVWSSPLERCRGPATLIARELRLPLSIDDRLKEIDLGEWQLRTWASIEATEPQRYKAWLEHWLTRAPPGGERPDEMLRRVETWWRQLSPGIHLLVSHAGVNRALRVLIDGKTWTEAMGEPVPHLQAESFRQSFA